MALALAIETERPALAWHGRRIAILLGDLAPGSRERVILAMAGRLRAMGAEVDLLTPGPSAHLEGGKPASVPTIDVGGRLAGNLPNIARLALSPPRIAAYLRRSKPDALLSLSIPPNLAALAGKRLAGGATPIVLRQSNVIRVDGSPLYGAIVRRWRDRLVRWLYPDADAVITVSDGVADNLRHAVGIAPEKIHAIANGVPLDRIDRLAAAPSPEPWLDDRSCPVILAVGRLVQKKDYPTLLKAFARLRRKRPARLIILGDGRERPTIERLRADLGLDDDVALPGRVDNPFAYLARFALRSLLDFRGHAERLDRSARLRLPGGGHRLPERPFRDPRQRPLRPAGSSA